MKRVLFALFGLLLSVPGHAAALPSGYTELTYIESTGTQYINTRIVPNNTTTAEVKFNNSKKSSFVFGSRWTASPNYDTFGMYTSSSGITSVQHGAAGQSGGGTSIGGVLNQDTIVEIGLSKIKVNDSTEYSYTRGDISTTLPMYLFADNQQGTVYEKMTGKVYYFKVWQGDSLALNLIPAKNSSNVIGMYDTVSGQFFTNSGSGSFLPGEELSPCRNLFDRDAEYINAYVHADSGVITQGTTQHSFVIPCKPNTSYTAQGTSSTWGSFVSSDIGATATVKLVGSGTITTGPNDKYLVGLGYATGTPYEYRDTLQIEQGSTATPYTPYDAQCGGCSGGGTLRNYVSATGTGTQVGTPTPENPIDPVFFRQGDMILRAVGDYKDTYNATTGKITRNVGVKVLDGTEEWIIHESGAMGSSVPHTQGDNNLFGYCSHFLGVQSSIPVGNLQIGQFKMTSTSNSIYFKTEYNTVATWTQYLAAQYAAGTPVTIWYPLATPVVEDWDGGATYCESGIKIATNLYNSAKFQNVIDALDTAVSTINTIVAGTIAQANSIGELASGKQTRPNPADSSDETCPTSCPNYRQCLLVEKDDGTPCWYEISDPFRDFVAPIVGTSTNPTNTTNAAGYTQLEYIESTGAQVINTGTLIKRTSKIVVDAKKVGSVVLSTNAILAGNAASSWASQALIRFEPNNVLRISAKVSGTTSTYDTNRHTYTLDINNGTGSKDGVVFNTFSNTGFSSTDNWQLFGVLWNNRYDFLIAARLYSVKIYDGNTLVRDMVPVRRNNDNKYGMYDKVNNVFYGDASGGATDFTPGPEVLDQDPAIPGMTWTATWTGGGDVTAGTVNGVARCTSVAGTNNYSTTNPTLFSQLSSANQTAWGTAFDASTVGDYKQCWCKVDNATTSGETVNPMGSTEWVFLNTSSSAADCAVYCAGRCAYDVRDYSAFRATVLGM